jgi:predicted naringenin-chalcone synthase
VAGSSHVSAEIGSAVSSLHRQRLRVATIHCLPDRVAEAVNEWLDCHPNTRIIDYAAKKLGIPQDRVVVNVDRYGNTSSGSIPLALADAEVEGRLQPGTTVLMTGMGAGLTWGSALMEWTANGRMK